jgi:hypothetical protein
MLPVGVYLSGSVILLMVMGAVITQFTYAHRNGRARLGAAVGLVIGILCGGVGFFILFRHDFVSFVMGSSILILLAQLVMLPFLSRLRHCPQCGTAVRHDYVFCQTCGHDISEIPVQPTIMQRCWNRFIGPLFLPILLGGVFVIAGMFIMGLVTTRGFISSPNAGVNTGLLPTPIPEISIVEALQNLPYGYHFPTTPEELSDIAIYIPWPMDAVPSGALTEESGGMDYLLDKIARTDIFREQPILASMIGENISLSDPANLAGNAVVTLPRGSLERINSNILPVTASGLLTNFNPAESWEFSSKANEVITFVLTRTDGDFIPMVMVWEDSKETWVEGQRATRGRTTSLTITFLQEDLYDVVVTEGWEGELGYAGSYQLSAVPGRLEAPVVDFVNPPIPTPFPFNGN